MNSLFDQFVNPGKPTITRVTGTFAASQLPDVRCHMLNIKAGEGNAGVILLSTDNVNFAFGLGAGDSSGWIPGTNLNEYYQQYSSGSSDYLGVWTLS